MSILNTPHKKKSAILTALMAALLVLLFFLVGLTYYDPPVVYGMEVNFGTSYQGTGNIQSEKSITSKSSQAKNEPIAAKVPTDLQEEIIQETVKEVLTEKNSKVTLPKNEKQKGNKPKPQKQEKAEDNPTESKKPKVSNITKSLVSNLLKNNNQQTTENLGEGDEDIQGNKGNIEGNLYSSSFFKNTGLTGIGKSYGLNGRSLQSNGKVVQDCNQEGTVVVRITVNKKGNVINAEPGVKGSTNTHPCLLLPAKKTALLHKWYPDDEAPEQQIGYVLIQFKLGE
jgi:outer membrane biosynthesis protein TonB